jgi:hypothetical protein
MCHLMISGMNHETLKWKVFLFSQTGLAKQWYKLHFSSWHGSWVILKDLFYFAFFPLSNIIDLHNEVLNFAQKEGESLGVAWSRYNQLALSGPEFSILDATLMQHFVHRLGTESVEYMDLTSRGALFIARMKRGSQSWIESSRSLRLKICKSKLR